MVVPVNHVPWSFGADHQPTVTLIAAVVRYGAIVLASAAYTQEKAERRIDPILRYKV